MNAPTWKIDQESGALVHIRSGREFTFGDYRRDA